MTVTYCLGEFARRLANTPREEWTALVQAQPRTCPQ